MFFLLFFFAYIFTAAPEDHLPRFDRPPLTFVFLHVSPSGRFVLCLLNHFPLSQIAPPPEYWPDSRFFPLLPQWTHLHLCTQQLITGWRWPCKLEGAEVALINCPWQLKPCLGRDKVDFQAGTVEARGPVLADLISFSIYKYEICFLDEYEVPFVCQYVL